MKKTSRRNFAKSVTAALAAAPVAHLTLRMSTEAQRPNVRPSNQRIISHQDTPPPIIIEEGSVKVDVKDQNLGMGGVLPPHPNGGYRWEFPKNNTTHDIFLVGMKIVTAADRLLFYLDRDFGTTDRELITVRILVDDSASAHQELVISTEGKFVTLKVPPNRELKRLATPDPGYPGHLRFRYHDQSGSTNYPIKSVAITAGGGQTVISRIDPSMLPEGSAGLKVMLWFEDVNG